MSANGHREPRGHHYLAVFLLSIAVLRGYGADLAPWAWGLNGAMSVVASVLAILIGSRWGFSAAFLTGVAAYTTPLIVRRLAIGLAHAPSLAKNLAAPRASMANY